MKMHFGVVVLLHLECGHFGSAGKTVVPVPADPVSPPFFTKSNT